MRTDFTVRLSRRFAGGLSIRSGTATSLDIALWLGAVSEAIAIPDEPDAEGLTKRDVWMVSDEAPVDITGSTMLRATGLRSHGLLVRPLERLAETEVSLGSSGAKYRLWQGWEADPVGRDNPVDRGIVSGMALATAMLQGQPFPVEVNLSAMAAFRSRFSAVVYLRALAWMAGHGTPTAWHRTKPGPRVSLTVPMADLPRALGTDSLAMMGDWNAKALGARGRGGPVHEDLATAGIRLATDWRMEGVGYGSREVPTALRITVSRIAGAQRRPLPRRPRQSSKSSSSSASQPA